MPWWNNVEPLAQRWVFDQDRLAYHLMLAAYEAEPDLQKQIVNLMTKEQREMARKAKDGTWKRF